MASYNVSCAHPQKGPNKGHFNSIVIGAPSMPLNVKQIEVLKPKRMAIAESFILGCLIAVDEPLELDFMAFPASSNAYSHKMSLLLDNPA